MNFGVGETRHHRVLSLAQIDDFRIPLVPPFTLLFDMLNHNLKWLYKLSPFISILRP